MTRLTKLSSVAMVSLFLFFSINVFAFEQGVPRARIPKMNWGNSMGVLNNETCVQVGGNSLVVHLNLGFARNDLQNFPPLYIGYDWGGYSAGVTARLTSADLTPAEINGYNAYETTLTFSFDLDGLCSPHNPSQELFTFNFQFELITMEENGQNVEPYPVLYEAWPLFPSHIFPETGEQGYTPFYSGQKYLCCQENDAPDLNSNEGAMIQNDGQIATHAELSEITSSELPVEEEETDFNFIPAISKTKKIVAESARIFPNPVDQILNIDLNVAGGDFYEIEILDLKGAVIKSVHREVNSLGAYKEQINVANVPQGIYFCRIHSATHTQTLKVTVL